MMMRQATIVPAEPGYAVLQRNGIDGAHAFPIVAWSVFAFGYGAEVLPIAIGCDFNGSENGIRFPDGRVMMMARDGAQWFDGPEQWVKAALAAAADRMWSEANYPCEGSA